MAEVREAAVDLAIAAAESVVEEKMSGAASSKIFKSSLAELKSRMN